MQQQTCLHAVAVVLLLQLQSLLYYAVSRLEEEERERDDDDDDKGKYSHTRPGGLVGWLAACCCNLCTDRLTDCIQQLYIGIHKLLLFSCCALPARTNNLLLFFPSFFLSSSSIDYCLSRLVSSCLFVKSEYTTSVLDFKFALLPAALSFPLFYFFYNFISSSDCVLLLLLLGDIAQYYCALGCCCRVSLPCHCRVIAVSCHYYSIVCSVHINPCTQPAVRLRAEQL